MVAIIMLLYIPHIVYTKNLKSNHQITARSIADHLKPEKEETVPIKESITVNRSLFNRIFTVALSLGTTIKQLLE